MAASLDTRLSITARAVAQLYSRGDVTLEQVRAQMRTVIAEAQTVAMLAGTQGQRSAEIDTALREIITEEYDELDRLLSMIEADSLNEGQIEQRLAAFSDRLEETRQEGERLSQQDSTSPLVPIVLGGALGALLGRILSEPRTEAAILPRIDGRQIGSLYELLGGRLDAISADFADGLLTVEGWYQRMERELRVLHSVYAQIGGGTLSEARIEAQLVYLQRWRDELLDGREMSLDAIRNRARMYLSNGQATLQEALTAQLGLPPMPAYPKDGTTSCLTYCKCSWRFERLEGSGNYDCYWLLRPAEHCDECVARAAAWNPIEVRNGVLQPYATVGVFA